MRIDRVPCMQGRIRASVRITAFSAETESRGWGIPKAVEMSESMGIDSPVGGNDATIVFW